MCNARRPFGRLFCWLMLLLATSAATAQTPSLTTITGTVYRADGTAATGTLIISWPTFSTADGYAVAGGSTSVNLSAGGALSVQLVPNAGATPAGTYYTVVYQLDDGVKTEYWNVPATSPTTITAVRTTPGAPGTTAQFATQQYVQSEVASKANDAAVVHLSGSETISGTKTFAVAPSLPNPVQSSDAATKGYVDSAVTTSGSGSYVSKAGDTMTGTLTLSGDPAASLQAATKHYVDTGLAGKADLVSGLVPVSELAGLNEFTSSVQMDDALTVSGAVQANSFVSTGSGAWSVEGSYGSLSPAVAGQSLIGFGTSGKVQVSENGGSLVEVAKLDSNGNLAENANTATQLMQTPTQCNGSFATGIQANGNANCSTADVIQLAETSAPAGIPNYGLFWFDASCHCPKVIDNNGQAVQLGLLNVFNPDANTLEERNSTTAQALRVYGTYTDASNYERVGLKWDTGNSLFELATENGGTGSQRGIGFLIGSTVRWAISTISELKPFADNSYNLGSTSLRVKNGYFGTAVFTPAIISPNVVNVTAQTAAITTTNLIASAPVGQFEVNVYVESDAACSAAGSAAVSVTIGWGDRTGARTMTAPLTGNGVASSALALGTTANFGEAVMSVWNNSTSNNLTYAVSYTGCTTGTGTYALYISARQVQ